MQTLPNRQVTHKSLCSLAIKTDKQPMLIIDFPWLPGRWPAVLAATVLFNKLYLPYILPCVWKFFSNLRSDHDSFHHRFNSSMKMNMYSQSLSSSHFSSFLLLLSGQNRKIGRFESTFLGIYMLNGECILRFS